jgi:pimeloyl-ACP methyl ester carboxylesterase
MKNILLLHGALGASAQLYPLKKALEEMEYTVHTLNFSGHGGELFRGNFGIAQFADDTLTYLNQQQVQQVHVFGYSMGGYVALWLARQHPQRIGKIITLGTKFDWSVESAEKEVKKLNPEKIQEKIPAFARILEHRHTPNDWKELLYKTAEMMLSLGEAPLLTESILRQIKTPTLICLGDVDDMADRDYSETVAGYLPNGSFNLLKNTPHPIEKCDVNALTQVMNNFLS